MPSSSSTLKTRSTSSDGTFVFELPLEVERSESAKLGSIFEASRQLYNACLGEALRRLALVRESKLYQQARKLPKKSKERTALFKKALEAYSFSEYSLHAFAAQVKNSWIGEHIGIHVAQKLATRAFHAAERVLYGKARSVRFKGKNALDSIEGKNNATGLIWKGDYLRVSSLRIVARIDTSDPVVSHGIGSKVKYCRLVRRRIRGRELYFVQLICEGKALSAQDRHLLRSAKPAEERRKGIVGESTDVGLDIGPSTIAFVGEKQASLRRFCDELESKEAEKRCLQRKNDRQRRANNPHNYNEDGTIKPGKKMWKRSSRQKQTEIVIAEVQRRQAAHRKSLHGQLLNSLPLTATFRMEKLSYRSFQKNFGRSVGMRAPGMFVEELKRKAENAGGSVVEFPTGSTRLSQTCHCGRVEKKPLSQRWHKCSCGVEAQRDLYSAYLSRFVREGKLDAADAAKHWQSAEPLLRTAFEQATESASSRTIPASFGAHRRQSRSFATGEIVGGEAVDAVANSTCICESHGEPKTVLSRTPWL